MNATLAIILVTTVVSFVAFNNLRLLGALWLWPPAVQRQGQYYRLLTYGVVHADFAHLAFNMITLYFFGGVIERIFTPAIDTAGYVAFYLGGLLVSILPSYLKHRHDPNYRSLGASGAVSAVLFAYILFQPWSLIFVFFVPVPAIVFAVIYVGYTIWADRQGADQINHQAHLWGAAYGVGFTLLLEPRVLLLFLQRLLNPGLAG